MKKFLAVLLLFAHLPLMAVEYHVGPNGVGTSGCTSNVAPWCSVTFAQNPSAGPDDIIWVHGGTYSYPLMVGTERYWRGAGTPGHPLTIRAYLPPGSFLSERATITAQSGLGNSYATMYISGRYTRYWGLEVVSANQSSRISALSGSTSGGNDIFVIDGMKILTNAGSDHDGLEFINNILHDNEQCFVPQNDTNLDRANLIVFDGNLCYYSGHVSTKDGGHGHGVYNQQQQADSRTYTHNIFEFNVGNGIQNFGSNSVYGNNNLYNSNIFLGNSDFDGARDAHELILSGSQPANNVTISDNFIATRVGGPGNVYLGQSTWLTHCGGLPCITGTAITGNYIFEDLQLLNVNPTTGITIGGAGALANTIIYNGLSGWTTSDQPNNTFSTPKSAYAGATKVKVYPSTYEPGRGTVAIHCPTCTLASTVPVDLSTILSTNDTYQVRYSLDYYGTPILSGTYAGGSVNIPMGGYTESHVLGTGDAAHNLTQPPSYLPQLAAFIVLKTGVSSTPTPTNSRTFTVTSTATSTKTKTPTTTPTAGGPTNTNTPTLTKTLTPTNTPVPLSGGCTYVQAEAGTLVAPMVIGSDALAIGGQYISSSDQTGTATFNFSLANNTYYFFHRVLSPNSSSDSLFVSVDGADDTTHIDDTVGTNWIPAWQMAKITDRSKDVTCNNAAPQTDTCQLSLVISDSPAAHTLRLRGRELGTQTDEIVVCPTTATPPDVAPTATPTFTQTPTKTLTPTGTQTPTNTPVNTNTPTKTSTKTPTRTNTPTPGGPLGPLHRHACHNPATGNNWVLSHRVPPSKLVPHTWPPYCGGVLDWPK